MNIYDIYIYISQSINLTLKARIFAYEENKEPHFLCDSTILKVSNIINYLFISPRSKILTSYSLSEFRKFQSSYSKKHHKYLSSKEINEPFEVPNRKKQQNLSFSCSQFKIKHISYTNVSSDSKS